MIQTPICDALGIEKPVFQGGMAWIADASLASAVSEAGGLGIISAMNANAEWLRDQIHELRERTDKPFGVNIMLMSPFVDEAPCRRREGPRCGDRCWGPAQVHEFLD